MLGLSICFWNLKLNRSALVSSNLIVFLLKLCEFSYAFQIKKINTMFWIL